MENTLNRLSIKDTDLRSLPPEVESYFIRDSYLLGIEILPA